jgi:DNA-binding NtrC family response regulator
VFYANFNAAAQSFKKCVVPIFINIRSNKEMQNDTYQAWPSVSPAVLSHEQALSAAVINNRVEALKALSNSLLSELETLRVAAADGEQPDEIDLADEVARFQVNLIRTALIRTGGRQRAAARLLNVKSTTLHAKIKKYGLEANVVGSSED